MYIKKITLKNFRLFKDEITLDLQPNLNGMDPSKFWGNYKVVNAKNKKYASTVNAIGGVNSSGKTTFIKAFELLKKHLKSFTFQKAFSKYFEQKMELYIKKHKKKPDDWRIIFDKATKEAWSEDITKPTKDFKELIDLETKALFNENVTSDCRGLPDKNIYIKLDLFDEEKEFSFEYKLNIKESKELFLDDSGKKIKDKNKYYKYIEKTIKNILILNTDNDDDQSLEEVFNNLWRELEDKSSKKNEDKYSKFLNLIKIVDSNISELNISGGTLKNFFLKSPTRMTVDFHNLSTGTKKLIKNFYKIFKAFKMAKKHNYTCLILIDEIENSLHFRLVDLIKQLVFNYSEDGNRIQLFYTSHNINSLDRDVDHRQIYFLDRDIYTDKLVFERVSKNLKSHNSLPKQFLNAKIGSHPSKVDIESFSEALIDDM